MKLHPQREAGILLHPTSLPGRFGIGDFGKEAEQFLDWAHASGLRLWQILPLGPPATGHSPYSCLSAFAGNPLLISPERLYQQGLLKEYPHQTADFTAGRIIFDHVIPWKEKLLRHAWDTFCSTQCTALHEEFDAFQRAPEQKYWLANHALFVALRQKFGQKPWWHWEQDLAQRRPQALASAREQATEEVAYQCFLQFLFFRQWQGLRQKAKVKGIRILGDLPIYVAHDSAEVWAHRHLFDLDPYGQPRAVAGVPPDYFSTTGQLWGNPLYNWDAMAEDGYAWWVSRLKANLRIADLMRIDHFRAFADYWRVPASEETAIHGAWVPGPGKPFFDQMQEALGDLPLIAEDLGEITPEVITLRQSLGLPGMKVLHFAFSENDSDHSPHRLTPETVVYTGTHDNDTTLGWFHGLDPESRRRLRLYTGGSSEEIHWELIRLAMTSVAHLAIVPLQDILGLGSEGRMNVPGVAEGNWSWRMAPDCLTSDLADKTRALVEISGRTRGG